MLDREEIKKIIPHRDPMLLVDKVIDLVPEEKIATEFYISPDREIFKGHFPDEPVLPGVYTVENMAQSADILILSCERYAGKTPLFLGINNVRFLKKIVPGSTIRTIAYFKEERKEKAIVTASCEVYLEETLAATGDVTLAMRKHNGGNVYRRCKHG